MSEQRKQKPMYFCLSRRTAEKFLCHNFEKIPNCNGKCATVFQTQKSAINSMRQEAKKALKCKDSFRFMVFSFYFSEISPIWIDEKEYKGQLENATVSGDGKVLLEDTYAVENCICIKDLFGVESWCFYKDKSKKLRYCKDYKIVDIDLNDDLSEPIYSEDNKRISGNVSSS